MAPPQSRTRAVPAATQPRLQPSPPPRHEGGEQNFGPMRRPTPSDAGAYNLRCPITHSIMHDPVKLHASGQVFERVAIEMWLLKCVMDGNQAQCPMTRAVVYLGDHLAPMPTLKTAIAKHCQAKQLPLPEPYKASLEQLSTMICCRMPIARHAALELLQQRIKGCGITKDEAQATYKHVQTLIATCPDQRNANTALNLLYTTSTLLCTWTTAEKVELLSTQAYRPHLVDLLTSMTLPLRMAAAEVVDAMAVKDPAPLQYLPTVHNLVHMLQASTDARVVEPALAALTRMCWAAGDETIWNDTNIQAALKHTLRGLSNGEPKQQLVALRLVYRLFHARAAPLPEEVMWSMGAARQVVELLSKDPPLGADKKKDKKIKATEERTLGVELEEGEVQGIALVSTQELQPVPGGAAVVATGGKAAAAQVVAIQKVVAVQGGPVAAATGKTAALGAEVMPASEKQGAVVAPATSGEAVQEQAPVYSEEDVALQRCALRLVTLLCRHLPMHRVLVQAGLVRKLAPLLTSVHHDLQWDALEVLQRLCNSRAEVETVRIMHASCRVLRAQVKQLKQEPQVQRLLRQVVEDVVAASAHCFTDADEVKKKGERARDTELTASCS